VYASEHDDYRIVNLGAAMLFNHNPVPSVTNYWTVDEEDLTDSSAVETKSYSTYYDVSFSAQLDIMQGQEIFANYGETWFEDRGLDLRGTGTSVLVRPVQELDEIGYCLSDITIGPSPIAGRGVFAARSFRAGDVVAVSPVFILPKHLLESSESNTIMLNYAISSTGSDVALVPIGKAGMMNNGGEAASNVEIVWFDWETSTAGGTPPILAEYKVDELEAFPYAKLDLAYRAMRDIEEGEELTVFYGAEWEERWAEHAAGEEGESRALLQSLGAPSGLFPDAWKNLKCFGQHCKRMARFKFMEMQKAKKETQARKVAAAQHAPPLSTPPDL
jgi:SET domain-containing protein